MCYTILYKFYIINYWFIYINFQEMIQISIHFFGAKGILSDMLCYVNV